MNKTLIALYATVSAWATAAQRQEKGATATEYALIIAGIAVVIVGAVAIFGGKLSTFFNTITGSLF